MVQTERLKWEISAQGMTPAEVAWHMGMSPRSFGRKLETGKFGSDEMQELTALLELRHPEEIFFAKQ